MSAELADARVARHAAGEAVNAAWARYERAAKQDTPERTELYREARACDEVYYERSVLVRKLRDQGDSDKVAQRLRAAIA